MAKIRYKGFKLGDRVSIKKAEHSYDDAPNITPFMVGTIKTFPPKVIKVPGQSGDYFAYVVFDETYSDRGGHIHNIRGGIDICNLSRAKKGS